MTDTVTAADVEAAAGRLDDERVVKHTPVERSTALESVTGAAAVQLKCEHLQWTGSFKTRGAYHKIQTLLATEDVDHVIAASAGNHAQGVALAATHLGVDATIVMPRAAPQAKVDATRGYGATVELVGKDFREAMAHARSLLEGSDAAFIHAYDDPDIIAGQGTLGLEIAEDVPAADTVVVPIGGGGLISGVGVALSARSPDTRLVGVQADSAATVPDSLAKGSPQTLAEVDTMADGIATGGISALTLSLIEVHVDEVVTVSDTEIADAILMLMQRGKQLVEGGGAAPVAAIMSGAVDVEGETVVPVLSGGNLDMTTLQAVLVHALTKRQQILQLRVLIDDRPGKMAELSGVIADHGANIHTVRHDRAMADLDVGEAYLTFQVETSGAGHARSIIDSIAEHGYEVVDLTAAGNG